MPPTAAPLKQSCRFVNFYLDFVRYLVSVFVFRCMKLLCNRRYFRLRDSSFVIVKFALLSCRNISQSNLLFPRPQLYPLRVGALDYKALRECGLLLRLPTSRSKREVTMCPRCFPAMHSPRSSRKGAKRRGSGLAVIFKESLGAHRVNELSTQSSSTSCSPSDRGTLGY